MPTVKDKTTGQVVAELPYDGKPEVFILTNAVEFSFDPPIIVSVSIPILFCLINQN